MAVGKRSSVGGEDSAIEVEISAIAKGKLSSNLENGVALASRFLTNPGNPVIADC